MRKTLFITLPEALRKGLQSFSALLKLTSEDEETSSPYDVRIKHAQDVLFDTDRALQVAKKTQPRKVLLRRRISWENELARLEGLREEWLNWTAPAGFSNGKARVPSAGEGAGKRD